jgi:phospholipid/cholesterol/gamma-HCH transport system ATP-binding protein
MEHLGNLTPADHVASLPALELEGVSISFNGRPAVSNVSFCVEKGETLMLLGEAASGKSVLLKLILGLLKADSGKILVNGQDIASLAETELSPYRRRMGMVFQEGALFDSLSVFENVAYRLREDGQTDEESIERRVREVLGFVEMEQAIDKMPSELSGGMKRRVSIARAIVSDPSIMLYDSPTAGLDPVTANTINELLAKLRDVGHVSSIVVTHRLQDAFILSRCVYSPEEQRIVPANNHGSLQRPSARFLVLRDGTAYFLGTEQDLTASADPYLRRFLS